MMIRPERPEDGAPLRALLVSAFGQPAEAGLVEALRAAGDVALALVAADDSGIIGHVLFSRLSATDALRASALAPLAVRPDRQRGGVGAALVRAGLEALAARGEDVVLVLGEPAYYGRFGFSAEAARAFTTPYDGPYLQAIALSAAGHGANGPLRYAPAFADLG